MRIDSISIRKSYTQDRAYDCEVTIDGEFQSMRLKLDEARTQAVIEVIADLIVEGSKAVAENLSKQALDHKPLEHKTA